MPSTIAFQIPVSIQNLVVHQCIMDEGASTCVMSTLGLEEAWVTYSVTIFHDSVGL